MSVDVSTDDYLRINEIKNYLYCPRIPYYALCMRTDRETSLSHMGVEHEATAKTRMKRRKYALHTIQRGRRLLDVPVVHHDMRLIGRIDEVVETNSGVYLVDYKDTDRDFGYWHVQIAAYQQCLESMGYLVLDSYIYSIPDQRYHTIKPTNRNRVKLAEIVETLQAMIVREVMPPPTPHHQKCQTCQYERFCNDVL